MLAISALVIGYATPGLGLPYTTLTAAERKTLAKLHGGGLESAYIEGTNVGYCAVGQVETIEHGRWTVLTVGD